MAATVITDVRHAAAPYFAECDPGKGGIALLVLGVDVAGSARGSPLVAEADWGPMLIALAGLPFIVR